MTIQIIQSGVRLDTFIEALSEDVPRRFKTAARRVSRKLIREFRKTVPRKSGKLARSFELVVTKRGRTVAFRFFSDSPYAAAQEFGGSWVARIIPLTPQARKFRSPRDFPGNLRPIRGKAGFVLKVLETARGVRAQYILNKQITLKPQRYLAKAETVIRPMISAAIDAELVRQAERAEKRAKRGRGVKA